MDKVKVPLLKQKTKLDCGIVALRMVLKYFKTDISSDKIIKSIKGIKKYGVRTIKLAEFAQGIDFKTEVYSYNRKLSHGKVKIRKPSKSIILNFLRKKLPVILAVNSSILYGKKKSEMGHFIVVSRYIDGKFWYNDPNDGKQHETEESKLMSALTANALNSSAYLLVLKK